MAPSDMRSVPVVGGLTAVNQQRQVISEAEAEIHSAVPVEVPAKAGSWSGM
jgi:hypothetical protein